MTEGKLDKINEIAHNLAQFSSGFQNHKAYAIHVASNMQVLFIHMVGGSGRQPKPSRLIVAFVSVLLRCLLLACFFLFLPHRLYSVAGFLVMLLRYLGTPQVSDFA